MRMPLFLLSLALGMPSFGCLGPSLDFGIKEGVAEMLNTVEGHVAAIGLVERHVGTLSEAEFYSLPGTCFEVDDEFVRADAQDLPKTVRFWPVAIQGRTVNGQLDHRMGPLPGVVRESRWRGICSEPTQPLRPAKRISPLETCLAIYFSRSLPPEGGLLRLDLAARDLTANPRWVEVWCESVESVGLEEITSAEWYCQVWPD